MVRKDNAAFSERFFRFRLVLKVDLHRVDKSQNRVGCPKQELFILHNRKELGVPISLGLGASIDFEAGNVKRAPKWMADHGLEWLYRITQDPRRLAKRYLLDDTKIFILAMRYKRNAEANQQ